MEMMEKTFWGRKYSAREIAEARIREGVILQWQRGEKLSRLTKGIGIKLTRAGWWLARCRYEKHGLAGLLDRRNGRKSVITPEIEEWVNEALEGQENVGRRQVQELIKGTFGVGISLPHISRLLRRIGVRRKRGGQKKEYTIDRDKGIPKVYFSTLKRMERGLHQYFIHSSKGDPLILMTCPGDTRLPGTLFDLIAAFENAIGKKIVKVAIFDREGLSLSIFEEFDGKKKYFICLLREDMYKDIESFKILKDFVPFKTVEKDGQKEVVEWAAEAEYKLKEKKKKGKKQRTHPVRVALVKRMIGERIKLIPIITNLTRKEEPNIARIARRYFDRWPYQENIFKDAMKAIRVDTNHGFKKREVPNRVAERKREELETNLRGITKKLRKATRERRGAAKALTKSKEFYQISKQIYQKEINDLYAKIGLPISEKERQQHLSRLKRLEKKLTRLGERCGKSLSQWEVTLKTKERHEKSLLTQKKNKEIEIKKLDTDKRQLYEIKMDKDHLMSNFKMLLINLSSHAQRRFFPEVVHSFTMDSMMKAFYQQDGYIKIKQKRIDVTLQSYDDPFLQKVAEYACLRFNESDRRALEGQRFWMWLEGSKCQLLNDN